MNPKFKALIKDTIFFAIGSIGSKLILFFLVPLYTNFLSTSEYGVADLIFTVSQLLIPIFSVVIYSAVLRFGLTEGQSKEDCLLCGYIVLIIGSIICIISTPFMSLYQSIAAWKWYLCIYIIFF
jgi:hypothetical protein